MSRAQQSSVGTVTLTGRVPRHGGDLGRPAATTSPRFALLLYDSPGAVHSTGGVAEHRAWAAGVTKAGHAISGEAFAPAERDAAPNPRATPPPTAVLSGYFIVSAASEDEAVNLARTSPHFRAHGRIVVRQVVETGTPVDRNPRHTPDSVLIPQTSHSDGRTTQGRRWPGNAP